MPFRLRAFSAVAPRILVIASSTGGPQALVTFFTQLRAEAAHIPVLVVQHMPAAFTPVFAQHLTKAAGVQALEGASGEPVVPGRIYVAPGGRHMLLAGSAAAPVIELNDHEPVHFCRPAADPLFRTAAMFYREAALGLVFTGMGADGAAGGLAIAEAGGSLIAQDEATSVVWGMPGAAVHAGATAAVLPLDAIAPKVCSLLRGTEA